MKFICGCEVPVLPQTDVEGFVVCSEHGLRRYGWRSLPMLIDEKGKRPNWGAARSTALEIESMTLAASAITAQ